MWVAYESASSASWKERVANAAGCKAGSFPGARSLWSPPTRTHRANVPTPSPACGRGSQCASARREDRAQRVGAAVDALQGGVAQALVVVDAHGAIAIAFLDQQIDRILAALGARDGFLQHFRRVAALVDGHERGHGRDAGAEGRT